MTLSELTKLIQKHVGVTADGIYGKNTASAVIKSLGIEQEEPKEEAPEYPSAYSLEPKDMKDDWELLTQCMILNIVNLEDPKCVNPETIRVTKLPAADRGGDWEVAGLSDGFEPGIVNNIRNLINKGNKIQAWHEMIRAIDSKSLSPKVADVMRALDIPAIEYRCRSFGFNAGLSAAIKCLQRALVFVSGKSMVIDGKWGPDTRQFLIWCTTLDFEKKRLLAHYNLKIQEYYKSLKQYKDGTFAKGWTRRWTEDERVANKFLDLGPIK